MIRHGCHLLICLSVIMTLFSIAAASLHPMSFDFKSSGAQQGECSTGQKVICLQGNASVIDNGIQLTTIRENDTGWAYYSEPLHLWDASTRELTNFTTNFALDIQSTDKDYTGDGIAFFLMPFPFQIPPNSGEDYLGLIDKSKANNVSGLIAVEFDTDYVDYKSDPDYIHIGIDINSLTSVKTEQLYPVNNNIRGNTTVSYDSRTLNLSVTFFDALRPSQVISLWYVVDMRVYLPEWVVVGLSGSTDYAFPELNKVTSWDFSTTVGDVRPTDIVPLAPSKAPWDSGTGTPNVTNPRLSPTTETKKPKTIVLLVAIIIGMGLVFIVAGSTFVVFWRRRRNVPEVSVTAGEQRISSIDDVLQEDKGPRRIPYSLLVAATKNFSQKNKLGKGGFGAVYKGFLQNMDLDVAVKRFSGDSQHGAKQYIAEVNIISQLRHKNLVQLVGWCHEQSELLLVYEFMPNGSLDAHLFNKDKLLVWSIRYQIAFGLASALMYLHTECKKCVVHRDIKSSNVMLDSDFIAKLGDFGLARQVDTGNMMQTTTVAGSFGYMAPECVHSGNFSKESDVYSFGIVLLEIACGRPAVQQQKEDDKVMLLNWVWGLYEKGRLLDAADPRLEGKFDQDEMEQLMLVGLWCASYAMKSRPSMSEAIAALKFDYSPVPDTSQKIPTNLYSQVSSFSLTTTTSVGKSSLRHPYNASRKSSSTITASNPSSSVKYHNILS